MNVKLIMFKSNGQRKEFPVSNPKTVLGRGEECDLRVPLLSVSRRQCELHFDGKQLKIKDLGSSNGTYVNNKRVNEAILKAGDRLAVGPVILTVQINGQPGEITPPKAQNVAEGSDEVVALDDADVIMGAGGSDDSDLLELAADDSGEVDPLSALEALAEEEKKPAPPPTKKK